MNNTTTVNKKINLETYEKEHDLMMFERADETDKSDDKEETSAEYETTEDACGHDAHRVSVYRH